MKKQKILYAITAEDAVNISDQEGIHFTNNDLPFIADKLGDYFGDKWQDAVAYALDELRRSKE